MWPGTVSGMPVPVSRPAIATSSPTRRVLTPSVPFAPLVELVRVAGELGKRSAICCEVCDVLVLVRRHDQRRFDRLVEIHGLTASVIGAGVAGGDDIDEPARHVDEDLEQLLVCIAAREVIGIRVVPERAAANGEDVEVISVEYAN